MFRLLITLCCVFLWVCVLLGSVCLHSFWALVMEGAQESHMFPTADGCCAQQDQHSPSAFCNFWSQTEEKSERKKSLLDCIVYCSSCALLPVWKKFTALFYSPPSKQNWRKQFKVWPTQRSATENKLFLECICFYWFQVLLIILTYISWPRIKKQLPLLVELLPMYFYFLMSDVLRKTKNRTGGSMGSIHLCI